MAWPSGGSTVRAVRAFAVIRFLSAEPRRPANLQTRAPANSRTRSRYASLTNERYAHQARRRFEFGSLRLFIARPQVPPRRLVPTRGALQRHPSMLEVQKRIVPVEPAEELPNLVGNHCAETPFQVPTCMTSVDLASLPGTPTMSPTFQDRCHAWGVIRKRLSLNGLTIHVVRHNSRPGVFVHQTGR